MVISFLWLELVFVAFSKLLLKIGGETLTIYAVHFVVLCGTWLGVGVSSFFKYSLSPLVVVIGAALFVTAHVILIAHIESVRLFIRVKMWKPLYRSLRIARIALLRSGKEWPRKVPMPLRTSGNNSPNRCPFSELGVKR